MTEPRAMPGARIVCATLRARLFYNVVTPNAARVLAVAVLASRLTAA